MRNMNASFLITVESLIRKGFLKIIKKIAERVWHDTAWHFM